MTTITDGTTTVTPTTVTGYQADQQSRNVLHTLIGAAGQTVTLLPTGLRSGRMTVVFPTLATAQALETMLQAASVFTLADPSFAIGMNFVLAANGKLSLQLDAQSSAAWLVVFDFQEV